MSTKQAKPPQRHHTVPVMLLNNLLARPYLLPLWEKVSPSDLANAKSEIRRRMRGAGRSEAAAV